MQIDVNMKAHQHKPIEQNQSRVAIDYVCPHVEKILSSTTHVLHENIRLTADNKRVDIRQFHCTWPRPADSVDELDDVIALQDAECLQLSVHVDRMVRPD